jgi:hypothetical protein
MCAGERPPVRSARRGEGKAGKGRLGQVSSAMMDVRKRNNLDIFPKG